MRQKDVQDGGESLAAATKLRAWRRKAADPQGISSRTKRCRTLLRAGKEKGNPRESVSQPELSGI
ncbi:MAG: hypothetical protein ACUVV5_08055 [Candidatus Aminicenantales bacterium]